MSKILSSLGIAVVATVCLSTSALADTVTLKGGTPVPVHLGSVLSSATATAGQTFRIIGASPLIIDGWVAVKNGAVGQGTVQAATPAGKSGKQGTLSLSFDWIYGADGSKIPLAALEHSQTGKNKTGSSNTANVGATLLLGPVGLFAHNFVKGHDINVPTSQVFKAYVGRTISIRASHMYSTH